MVDTADRFVVVKVARQVLRLLDCPDPRAKQGSGMAEFSDSAYFHRMHSLLFFPRELMQVLSTNDARAVAAFDVAFRALPWRILPSHPHISELPDDDLSPLYPFGRRLCRVLTRRARSHQMALFVSRARQAFGLGSRPT